MMGNLCVLNGMFKQERDNYTCISFNGQSVVNYVMVPCDIFCSVVNDFRVELVTEVINRFKLTPQETSKASRPFYSYMDPLRLHNTTYSSKFKCYRTNKQLGTSKKI